MKKKTIKKLDESFDILQEYYQKHGTINFVTKDTPEEVLNALKNAHSIYDSVQGEIPEDLKEKYQSIGMIWEGTQKSSFMRASENLKIVEQYYRQHGTLIPVITDNTKADEPLKIWETLCTVINQNNLGKLPQPIKDRYDQMGMMWSKKELKAAQRTIMAQLQYEESQQCAEIASAQGDWESCFNLAKQYVDVFGTPQIPRDFEICGVNLGKWVVEQKDAYSKMELSIDRAQRLYEIGLEWGVERDHVSFDESVIAYYVAKCFPDTINSFMPPELNGRELDIYIPSLRTGIEFDGPYHMKILHKDLKKNQLCKENGFKLVRIRTSMLPLMSSDDNCTVINLHGGKNQGLLGIANKEKMVKKVLEALGVSSAQMPSIDIRRDKHEITGIMVEDKTFFNQYLMAARNFVRANGHLLVPRGYKDPTGVELGEWINSIRNSRQYLTERQKNALDDVGMVWRDVKKEKWLTNFEKVCSFGGRIPNYATTTDGKPLRVWYEQQKQDYKNSKMTKDYKLNAMKNLHIRDKNKDTEER